MPYIPIKRRSDLEAIVGVGGLLEKLDQITNLEAGDINYLVTKIIYRFYRQSPCYGKANELLGVLDCVGKEFYRRVVAPYEDKKSKENGDVF